MHNTTKNCYLIGCRSLDIMFNEKNPQIDNAYLEGSKTSIDIAKELAKLLIQLAKVLKEARNEKQEEDKIAVKVGEETYNLVEDKNEPGAYKWEKVDLTNESQSEMSEEQPFTDYEAQTLATKLITEAPDNFNYENLGTSNPAIQIVSLDNERSETVLYEMSERGETVKNTFTEILTQEEIIDVAHEPLTNILPPNSPLLLSAGKEDIEKQEDINVIADEMLSQVVDIQEFDNDGLVVESKEETINQTTETTSQGFNPNIQSEFDNDELVVKSVEENINTENQPQQNKVNQANFIAGATASEISINEPLNTAIVKANIESVNNELVEDNLSVVKRNQQVEVEEEPFTKKNKTQNLESEDIAANYTYKQVAANKEVEPRAQQWAKQSTVSVEKIKHRGERKKVEFEKNQNIAKTATEMLKKYGTIENDGSRIYRSDAFAIRKVDGVVSIHRRGDEAKGFKEPLMEFKLDKKGVPDIKGTKLINKLKRNVTQNNMLPVEKQEFLIVAERLNQGKPLPDLQSGDVRQTGNALGSLAPAGTLKTLEAFKKTEMLEMLNSTLNQVKSDRVTAGEFTIKRERDIENNRASLTLIKESENGKSTQLVKFNLEKTSEGIKSEVAKMNISDYDIGQIKHIAQNAYKLNNKSLESNFDNREKQPIPTPEINTKSIGDIPVDIHPWIADEWQKMTKEKPLWGEVVEQGNDEIIQKLKQNEGKLPIADQREMYDKIIMHKITQAQATGDEAATIDYAAKKDITAELIEARSRIVSDKFTPTQNISQKAQTKKQEARQPVKQKQEVEL